MHTVIKIVGATIIFFIAMVVAQAQINSPNKDIKTVVVDGLGSDVQSAAQNAAQNALTNVVGSFMDANKIMEKQTAIRDGIRSQTTNIKTDIKEYSQGSIQSLEILEAKNEGGLTRVTAKVAVRIEDFRAYIKKLAEGEVAVGGGLFAHMTTEKKQADNLTALVKDNIIMPILTGEVVRFDVSAPQPFSALPESSRTELERRHKPFIEQRGRMNVVHFTVIAKVDSGLYENMINTINATAAAKKRGNIIDSYASPFETNLESWVHQNLGLSRETDWCLLIMQQQKQGPNPIEAFRLKDVKSDLVHSMGWLARESQYRPPLRSVEISLLDGDGRAVQWGLDYRR